MPGSALAVDSAWAAQRRNLKLLTCFGKEIYPTKFFKILFGADYEYFIQNSLRQTIKQLEIKPKISSTNGHVWQLQCLTAYL